MTSRVTSSVAGLVGFSGRGDYVAAKQAVIGLTRTVALEYAQHCIRVNAVCPGHVMTPLLDGVLRREPERLARMVAAEPVGRLGQPEEWPPPCSGSAPTPPPSSLAIRSSSTA